MNRIRFFLTTYRVYRPTGRINALRVAWEMSTYKEPF